MRFVTHADSTPREGRLGLVKMACGCTCEDPSVMIVDGAGMVWTPEAVAWVVATDDLEAEVARIAGYVVAERGPEPQSQGKV